MKALYIILAVTLVLLIALVVVWVYQRKKAKAAAAESEEPAGPGGDEISLLIHEAERKLSAARLAQGSRIGNLPVYLLMGDPGSTKTSVMLHSGLETELIAGQVYESSNVIPTRTANLWFSRRSIFLEAGGTLPGDAAKWKGLVKKLQPRSAVVGKGEQAPRAAVVFFDCENFARQGAQDFVVAAGRTLRARLIEISQALGINLPVYVLFSKMDRLPFFAEFVHNLSMEEATQVLGVTLPMVAGRSDGVYAEQENARLTGDFERLFHSLADARPELLARENDATKLPGAYEFPREFRKLRLALVQFLVDICRPAQLSVGPFLRGFYFTGVRPVLINESAPISAAAPQQQAGAGYGTASDATGIFRMGVSPQAQQAAPAPQIGGTRKVPQWLFLSHLFNDVLLADNAAMGSSGASIKTSFARRLLLGIAAGLCFFAALGFTLSFFKNRALEAEVRDAAVGIPSVQLAATDLAPVDHLRKLETLRQSMEWLSYYRREGAPWGYRWFLYVGNDLYPEARRIYFDRFRQLLLAQTQGAIVRFLKGLPPTSGPASPEYQPTYDALKAYLITTSNSDKSTRQFLPPVLMKWWANNRTVDAERSQLARKQFDYYENELREANPFSKENDVAAIDRSRRYLAQFAGAQRVYAFMLSEAGKGNPPVDFNRQFPGSAQVVLQTYIVPGAFSKGGWAFMKDAIPNADKYFSGEKWVLGDQTTANIDRSKLEQDVRTLYFTDFIKHWRAYIKSASVVKYAGLKDASEKLTQLSGVQSPLLELLALASVNTAVDDPGVAKMFQPVQAVVPPGSLDRFILPPNQNYMNTLAALQAAVDAVAGPGALNDATAAPTLASAQQAKLAVRQIAQGFVIDSEGHIEGSVQKLLEDPILYVDPWVRGAGAAELNAKGGAMCKEFKPVMAKYPFKPDAKVEATVGDLNRLFHQPEGELWILYDSLKKLLPKQGGQYVPAPGGTVALTPQFVSFFNVVAGFAEALYANNPQDPSFKYTLKPYPSDVFQSGTLKIDGQVMNYSASALTPKQFIWQGGGEHGETATVKSGGIDFEYSRHEGLWSVFRFFADALPQALTSQLLEWVVGANKQPMKVNGKTVTVQFDLDMGGGPAVFQKGWFSHLSCVADVAK
jgi:type VI secretion system protein ImpL